MTKPLTTDTGFLTRSGQQIGVPLAEIASQIAYASVELGGTLTPPLAVRQRYINVIDDVTDPDNWRLLAYDNATQAYRVIGAVLTGQQIADIIAATNDANLVTDAEKQRIADAVVIRPPAAMPSGSVPIVEPFGVYTLAAVSYDGLAGLENGQWIDVLAPTSGSATLTDGVDVSGVPNASEFNLELATISIDAGDKSISRIRRIGSQLRVDGTETAAQIAAKLDALPDRNAFTDADKAAVDAFDNATIVRTDGTQSITGDKDFTGQLSVNGADVATVPIVTEQTGALDTALRALIDEPTIVRTDEANVISGDTNFTGDVSKGGQELATEAYANAAAAAGVAGLTKADVGLGNVQNLAPSDMPISDAVQTALDGKLAVVGGALSGPLTIQGNTPETTNNRGAASGYAPLDAGSKIPAEFLPEGIVSGMDYVTAWNASANDPVIPAAAAGNRGDLYIVATAGSQNLGGGSVAYGVGDLVISNGTVWERIPSVVGVVSVNGMSGAVTVTKATVGLGNVDDTSDANKPISTATAAALGGKANLASPSNFTVRPQFQGVNLATTDDVASAGGGDVLAGGNNTFTGVNNFTGSIQRAGVDVATENYVDVAVADVDAADVGLGSVDNTADSAKPVSGPQQSALNLKLNASNGAATGTLTLNGEAVATESYVGAQIGANVVRTDTSQTITGNKDFTGLVTIDSEQVATQAFVADEVDGLDKTDIGLGNVENLAPSAMPISTATQTALDGKASLAGGAAFTTRPTFSGSGLATLDDVAAGGVDTSVFVTKAGDSTITGDIDFANDVTKDGVALATTGDVTAAVSSVTRTSLGLGLVDNTSDAQKPISSATQAALNLKADTSALAQLVNQGELTAEVDRGATRNVSGGLAELKAIPAARRDNHDLFTTAYREADKGGGGLWEWRAGNYAAAVAADPDEGMVAAADDDATGVNGAFFRIKATEFYEAAWWGVSGAATRAAATDQGPALFRCMEWVALHGGKGKILLPQGIIGLGTDIPKDASLLNPVRTSTFDGGLVLFRHDGMTLIGQGIDVTVLYALDNADAGVVSIGHGAGADEGSGGQDALVVDYTTIEDLTIDGNKDNQRAFATGNAPNFPCLGIAGGATGTVLRRIKCINGHLYGIGGGRGTSGGTHDSVLEDIIIENTNGDGIDFKDDHANSTNNKMVRCRVKDFGKLTGVDPNTPQAGIDPRSGWTIIDPIIEFDGDNMNAAGTWAIDSEAIRVQRRDDNVETNPPTYDPAEFPVQATKIINPTIIAGPNAHPTTRGVRLGHNEARLTGGKFSGPLGQAVRINGADCLAEDWIADGCVNGVEVANNGVALMANARVKNFIVRNHSGTAMRVGADCADTVFDTGFVSLQATIFTDDGVNTQVINVPNVSGSLIRHSSTTLKMTSGTPAGTRNVQWATADVPRFDIRPATDDTSLNVVIRDDEGNYAADALKIRRDNGGVDLSGPLTMNGDPATITGGSMILNSGTPAGLRALEWKTADVNRFKIRPMTDDTGLEFSIFNDAGAFIKQALIIDRADGHLTVNGDLSIANGGSLDIDGAALATLNDIAVKTFPNKSSLAAVTSGEQASGDVSYLRGYAAENDGGQGLFTATGDDISAGVAADPQGAVYIPFADDMTGAAGGLVRSEVMDNPNVRHVEWFPGGGADHTLQIKQAVTSAGQGGDVVFPARTLTFSDDDDDEVGLWQLTGQTWRGVDKVKSVLLLSATETDIRWLLRMADGAEDCVVENLTVDGNRGAITPTVDLYTHFNGLTGAVGGKRNTWRNMILRNNWGRGIQTSFENAGASVYADQCRVEAVDVINNGTKGIILTKSRNSIVEKCSSQVDCYTASDHPGGVGDGNAGSGSLYEFNDAYDSAVSNSTGEHVGTSLRAPGIRLVNTNRRNTISKNKIRGATYLGFIQNSSETDFEGNIGVALETSGFFVGDVDTGEGPCVSNKIRNNFVDYNGGAGAICVTGNPSNAGETEVEIYGNTFNGNGGDSGGVRNNGVTASGGTIAVREWENTFLNLGQSERYGAFAADILGQPISAVQSLTDGTATEPPLAFAAEPNTGFYREGAGIVTFASQGDRKVVLSPTGIGLNGAPGASLSLIDDNVNIWLTDSSANNSRTVISGNDGTLNLSADSNNLADGTLIRFQLDGSEAARFDENLNFSMIGGGDIVLPTGRIGIGVSGPPPTDLAIQTDNPTVWLVDTDANNARTVITGNGGTLNFSADSTGLADGTLIRFQLDGSEAARFDDDRHFTMIGGGDIVMAGGYIGIGSSPTAPLSIADAAPQIHLLETDASNARSVLLGVDGSLVIAADDTNVNAGSIIQLKIDAEEVGRFDEDGKLSLPGSGSIVIDGVKVLGSRVINAALANSANTGDANTDALINALRDVVITQGSAAAA